MASELPWPSRLRAGVDRCANALLGVVSFAAPFAVSLAANVTEGLQSGSRVRLAAGVAIPILLIIAIEVWLRMPPITGPLRWVLRVAMAAPVVVAGGWSWLDTTSLLLSTFPHDVWFVPWLLCVSAPLAADGLAVLAVVLRHMRQQQGRGEFAEKPTVQEWGPATTVTTPEPPVPAEIPDPTPPKPTAVTTAPTAPRPVRPAPSPAATPAPAKRTTAKPSSQSRLRERAKALGVPYSGKTGYRELRIAVEKAEAAKAEADEPGEPERVAA